MDVGDCDGCVPTRRGKRRSFTCTASSLEIKSQGGKEVILSVSFDSYRINAQFSPSTECWSEVRFWLGCVLKWSPLVLISWPQSQPIRCPASIPLWLLGFVMVFVSRGDWHPCFRSVMDEIWLWLPMLHFHMGKSHCNLDRSHGVHCPHMSFKSLVLNLPLK